jgi:hypothetical protein
VIHFSVSTALIKHIWKNSPRRRKPTSIVTFVAIRLRQASIYREARIESSIDVIFTTLISKYQEFWPIIAKAIKDNPKVGRARVTLAYQVNKVLIEPLQDFARNFKADPVNSTILPIVRTNHSQFITYISESVTFYKDVWDLSVQVYIVERHVKNLMIDDRFQIIFHKPEYLAPLIRVA